MNTSSTLHGLTAQQVAESRAEHGENILTPTVREPLWHKFLAKFCDPLIVILLIAGLLSIGIALYEYFATAQYASNPNVFFEPAGIFVAIFLATGLSFYFEEKADRAFALLNQVGDEEPVQVVREGRTTEVSKREVVVGDLVVLTTGCEIPADGRLLESVQLGVDESTLTGEPHCDKTTDPALFDPHATFPSDHVLRGTKVMTGHGVMQVTAVGDATENGKVYTAAQIDSSVKTPLNEQLEGLAHKISLISYSLALLIVLGRMGQFFLSTPAVEWTALLSYLLQTLMIAVTLIVVAVPEGLPMAVTLSLAYSMRRMLRTNNLVRRMHACETMGATTVICTDKTGTLTQNQMRVHEAVFFALPTASSLEGSPAAQRVVEAIAANSTAQLDLSNPTQPKVLGNPTEGALLLWLHAQGIDVDAAKAQTQALEELPFSTERKFMATVVRSALTGKRTLYVKGAPEIVLSLCAEIGNPAAGSTGVTPTRQALSEQLLAYQSRALRTLGFASAELDDERPAVVNDTLSASLHLHFDGFVAIADPVRQDVPQAISECLQAGISIKIVTGDTVATAKEIGRQIGLWQTDDTERNIITGPDFAALSDEELRSRILDLKIIARARPLDKKRLVETLQALGQVVAVTGDGTNDAPALKAAHIGLSMGDGTSVAKEASDITILDNSFTSINRAVMWGRSLYLNIRRFILFQMTVNVAACLIVLIGAFLGTTSPITVTQMLWVNLIMDTFAAMALASLPPSHRVMSDKPRARTAFIISPATWRTILATGVTFTLALLALLLFFRSYDVPQLCGALFSGQLRAQTDLGNPLSHYELSLFFTFFVMLQFWNMFNARAFQTGRSAFHFKGCQGFLLIVTLILAGQVAIVTFGGKMFSVTPLSFSDWLLIIFGTSPVLLLGEAARLLKQRQAVRCAR